MNKLLIINVFILLIFSSCTFNTSGTWKNDNIETGLKNKMDNLNSSVIEFLYNEDVEGLEKMYSEKLLEYEKEHEFSQSLIDFSNTMEGEEYQVIDHFHTVNIQENASNIQLGDNYKFSYEALNKEMYVSILEIEGKYNNSFLAGIIYGKYGNDWKINVLQIGEYSLDGKNAEILYKISQQQYEKGHFVDAVNHMFLADKLRQPLKEYWTYNNNGEMKSYFDKITQEIGENFEFPIEVESIESKPVILGVSPQIFEQGLASIVSYKSDIHLNDSIQLREEYLQLHQEIDDIFKGLKRENKYIIYKAFEEIPDGINPVKSYSFVHKK